ncbi:MAG: FG-GAP-like repeat-containing protein [Saprospiraceae bacterium]|nr:FG-GAP-like repeat-containing protein [Saprospiraceae bacterium]MCF8249880.1 FG-GAP-like repeat-containing protein [Saprospiraceae bacterium]MCF8279450.1 FG-GAP-like repeat-containing protein [Bacteroidales bacterium]MCF8311686.1 FG-GAP-like repeat-containing protein [Saprospiraceae bacterium]MCF8440253.1 FG-GAP-like repeat-containing protein [Saprospiraceae bacterium]
MNTTLLPANFPSKHFLLFLILATVLLYSKTVNGQSLTFANTVPSSLTVCQPGEQFTVSFTNITGSTMPSFLATVQFPTGVTYVAGSLTNVNGTTVVQQNITNLGNVTFSGGSLANNASVQFTITAEAAVAAYTAAQSGTVFKNTVSVTFPGGSGSNLTNAYNLLYPALSITTVNAMAASAYVGQTFTRTVTIVNGGYGKASSITLLDTHNSNLLWVSADKGTLNPAGSILTLSSADFAGVGDGDGFFEQNEAITITQTITASGCSSAQSTLQAFWGCNNQTSGSNLKYPYTTISLYAPTMAAAVTQSFNTCVDGSANLQSVKFTNNGTGPANAAVLNIFQNPGNSYSRIDPSSIQYNINGGSFTTATPTSTTTFTDPGCLGSTPVKAFLLSLPNVPPGSNILVRWNSYTCTSGVCTAMDFMGWEYSLAYTDMCNSKNYTKAGVGQAPRNKDFSVFAESPSDLTNGQVGEYVYTLTKAVLNMPSGTTPLFEAVFDLPDGLKWSGNNSDLTFNSGQTAWTPSTVVYSAITKQLKASYPYPVPFTLDHAELHLKLSLDCTVPNVNGMATVNMQLFYNMNNACSTPFRLPLTCSTPAVTNLHCSGTCTEGLNFKSFQVERESFGQPDNNADGLPDSGGSLDLSKIRKNRVMVSDLFKTTFVGEVKTSAQFPNWSYGKAVSIIPQGDKITVQSASVSITDASTGQVLTCNNVPFTNTLSGTVRTVKYDFSASALSGAGCSAFSGFVMENGDQITVVAHYKVTGNIGGAIQQIQILNDFYVSPTANGTTYQCDDWNGNLTIVGYYFEQSKSEDYTITECTKTIEQSFYMSIGNCCSNFAGGDYFPYEYRNWAKVKKMTVAMPAGYSLVSSYMKHYRTRSTNATTMEQVNITPSVVSGQNLTFELGNYFTNSGGSLNPSDDGFNGTVYLEVKPTCTTQVNSFKNMTWTVTFLPSTELGGTETTAYTSTADRLKYRRGKPVVSTLFQTVDGVGTTVSWDVAVANSTAPAPYTWIFPFSPNSAMNVVEVKDLSNNSIITPQNGFYQLGNYTTNQSKNYRITASYNSCAASSLVVYSGYNCDGYPNNLGTFPCTFEEYLLYVNPQPSELQVKLNTLFDANDPCNPIVGMEMELLSAKLGAVTDIDIALTLATNHHISLVNGSVQKKYPAAGSFQAVATPPLVGNTYNIAVNSLDATIASKGLVGITDVTSNKITLRMNMLLGEDFLPGETVYIDVDSKRACKDPMPRLSTAFDPNAVFQKKEGIGFSATGDHWGASWGDYDNDGYPDLFLVTNDISQPNELYHNNHNGTFTKVTSGPIATDHAPSVSSSWADYDNDGDLDLYVGNNIGYPNYLYRNEGSGSFTKILNDPIVTDIGYSHGVSWGDYDNDGFVDMFVATFWETNFNLLYHNNGDGSFSKASNNAIANEASKSVSGVWGDYNNDGFVDLFVSNAGGKNNSLYKNKGNGNFEKITSGAIVTDGGNSVGGSWGDFNNDGYLDLFVANAGTEHNFLYKNNGNGTFTKITNSPVVTNEGHSHGSAWCDFDNDGDLDLFIANDGQNNRLYRNDGNEVFALVDNAISNDGGLSFGAAWADFDLDGDLDLYVANRENTGDFIYENVKANCMNSISFKLHGTASNAAALGARVYGYAIINGQPVVQMQQVSAQTGGGTGSQSDLVLTFGLGDANVMDSVLVVWPSGYRQKLSTQAANQRVDITEENASEVCGMVYFDANDNCQKDAGEAGIPNTKIVLQPGDISAYTADDGRYSVFVKTGTYTIQEITGGNWSPICPNPQGTRTVNVSALGKQFCDNDFGNTAACALPDLYATVATTAHRIGSKNLMVVNFENMGATKSTATLMTVNLPAAIQLLTSTLPFHGYEENTATWQLGELQPGQKGAIYLTYQISGGTAIGSLLHVTAILSCNEEDCNTSNDRFTESSMAVASFDPNDISVNPERFVREGEWLQYKIRFQNVGNLPAAQVRVEDLLPAELDATTLEMGTASHTFKFQSDGDKLVWIFPNINLADSLNNEPESHGFLTFRIKLRAGLELGTEIRNKANIYFDGHQPVLTNTVENILVAPNNGRTSSLTTYPLMVYPSPSSGKFTIQSLDLSQNPSDFFVEILLLDQLGKPVFTATDVNSQRALLEVKEVPAGTYFVKAVDNNGELYLGKVVLAR